MITFKSIDQARQQMSYGFVKTDLLSFDDNITQKLFFGLIRLRFWIFQKWLGHGVDVIHTQLNSLADFHAVLNRILIVQTGLSLFYFLQTFVQQFELLIKPIQSFLSIFPFLLISEGIIMVEHSILDFAKIWALETWEGFSIWICWHNLIIGNSFRFSFLLCYYPFQLITIFFIIFTFLYYLVVFLLFFLIFGLYMCQNFYCFLDVQVIFWVSRWIFHIRRNINRLPSFYLLLRYELFFSLKLICYFCEVKI